MFKRLLFLCSVLFLFTCSNEETGGLKFSEKGREVPPFLADSAYKYIQDQVDFGPRNPNSYGHVEVQKYLVESLKEYAGENLVFVQRFTHIGYGTDTLRLGNIVASFNPTAADRIMLSAHYDTRPRAEHSIDRPADPIVGADDGGSGVGVLLELARMFRDDMPPVGVDIVLFDGEDYGTSGDIGSYFLGSRYWAQNPPVPGYKPRFGILLDMVGGINAGFPKELNSYSYAPGLVNELWDIAAEKGYGDIFLDEQGGGVQDDHVVVNQYANIPMIDIINHRSGPGSQVIFPVYWHTHNDNMRIISKETLQAVGNVLSEFIYNRL